MLYSVCSVQVAHDQWQAEYTATVINSLLHPFSFQRGLDQIKVFVEPLPECEGTSTQLVSTHLLVSDSVASAWYPSPSLRQTMTHVHHHTNHTHLHSVVSDPGSQG